MSAHADFAPMPAANDGAWHFSPVNRGLGFSTAGTWFGDPGRPLAGWWTAPDRASASGVVIAPALGYEYWSCYRSLRVLAEALAQAGWHVLRFDWDGTGNSAGEANDPDRVAAWRASLAAAVACMRGAGMEHIALVGIRLGATLALLDAASLGVDAIVACAPVGSGKRWHRELKMLGVTDPAQPGTMTYSGLVIDSGTAKDLAAIDLARTAPPSARRTLLVTRSESADAALIGALRSDGRSLDIHGCEAMHTMLDVPAGEDEVPENFIEPIIQWLGAAAVCESGAQPPTCQAAGIPCGGGQVMSTFTTLADLAVVRTEPTAACDTVVVFFNSGADPHVGPGRAWVEYARALASAGYAVVQPDFTAFGESPDHGRPPGRPYDPHCLDDARRLVAVLRQRYRKVVLAGLCVGAWIAMLAAQEVPVDGVFALNPQLWWKPGLPIIIRIPETIAWRAPMRERGEKWARVGLWSLLDALGIRPMASRWLIALRRRRIPVMLSYAEGDDGLTHLRNRCARRLAREARHGLLTLEEVPGIDHPMFRIWRRPAIIEQMLRFLGKLPPARLEAPG